MEFDAFAQMEGIRLAILRDLPAFGEGRLDLGALVFEVQEGIEEVASGASGVVVAHLLGIERGRLSLQADDESAALYRTGCTGSRGRGRRFSRDRRYSRLDSWGAGGNRQT